MDDSCRTYDWGKGTILNMCQISPWNSVIHLTSCSNNESFHISQWTMTYISISQQQHVIICIYVAWLINRCDMTRSYKWPIQTCAMTHMISILLALGCFDALNVLHDGLAGLIEAPPVLALAQHTGVDSHVQHQRWLVMWMSAGVSARSKCTA